MKIKKVLGLMMAVAMVGMTAAPAMTSEAAGLTQQADVSKVVYGKVNEAERALLRQLFDADYYLSQNQDLVEKYANDVEGLFNHFCNLGLWEGRSCNADFDPSAYASAYTQLANAYGTDILKYYIDYLTDGITKGRNITTLADCAANGITVTSLVAPEVSITPATYRIAVLMGTNDMAAVQQAVDRAVEQAEQSKVAAAISSGDTTVVLVPVNEENAEPNNDANTDANGDANDDNGGNEDNGGGAPAGNAIYEKASGLVSAGTMTIDSASGSGLFHILIYKNNTGNGYAAYTTDETDWSMPPVTQITTIGEFAGLDNSEKIGQVSVNGLHASNSEVEEWESASAIPTSGTFVNAEYESWSDSGTNEKESTGVEVEYSVTYGEMTFNNSTYHDEEGVLGSEYEVGFKFTESSEDSVSFEVGVYNEDTGFAVVDEVTETPEDM